MSSVMSGPHMLVVTEGEKYVTKTRSDPGTALITVDDSPRRKKPRTTDVAAPRRPPPVSRESAPPPTEPKIHKRTADKDRALRVRREVPKTSESYSYNHKFNGSQVTFTCNLQDKNTSCIGPNLLSTLLYVTCSCGWLTC
jgi:hypothetical protein